VVDRDDRDLPRMLINPVDDAVGESMHPAPAEDGIKQLPAVRYIMMRSTERLNSSVKRVPKPLPAAS